MLLIAGGCSRPATSPLSGTVRGLDESVASGGTLEHTEDRELVGAELPGGRAVVDLRFGRVSRLENHFRVRVIPTGGVAEPWFEVREAIQYEIIGTDQRNGVDYAVERTNVRGELEGFLSLLRQDRSGLYLYQEDLEPLVASAMETDGSRFEAGAEAAALAAITQAAAGNSEQAAALQDAWARIRARRNALAASLGATHGFVARGIRQAGPPGGAGRAEITFLRYPLHPGGSWEGRIGFNIWTVEALETVETPAGRFNSARLRIDLPRFFGPGDLYLTWWGAPGELRRHFIAQSIATNGSGEEIGILESEQTFTLVEFNAGGTRN